MVPARRGPCLISTSFPQGLQCLYDWHCGGCPFVCNRADSATTPGTCALHRSPEDCCIRSSDCGGCPRTCDYSGSISGVPNTCVDHPDPTACCTRPQDCLPCRNCFPGSPDELDVCWDCCLADAPADEGCPVSPDGCQSLLSKSPGGCNQYRGLFKLCDAPGLRKPDCRGTCLYSEDGCRIPRWDPGPRRGSGKPGPTEDVGPCLRDSDCGCKERIECTRCTIPLGCIGGECSWNHLGCCGKCATVFNQLCFPSSRCS